MTFTRPAHGDPFADGSATDLTVVLDALSSGVERIGLSVRDFGAVGDGVTDDAAAFAAAILALQDVAANGSGVILVPVGRYAISAPIVLTPGVTLRGSGGWDENGGATTIKARSNFTGDALITSSSWTGGDWAHGVCVEGLNVDCDGIAVVGVAIHQMGEECVLDRVHVVGATDSGFWLTGDHAAGTVLACSAWSCTNYGVKMSAHPTVETSNNGGIIRFLGLSGDFNGAAHVYLDGSQRLQFIGMKSEGHAVGVWVAGAKTGGDAASVLLSGSFNYSPGGVDVVKVTGTSTPALTLLNVQQSGYTNFINDTVSGKALPVAILNNHPTVATWNGSAFHGGEQLLAAEQFISARDPSSTTTKKTILGWSNDQYVSVIAGSSTGVAVKDSSATVLAEFQTATTTVKNNFKVVGTVGFNGATPAAKPAVTGSRSGNAALADLLTKLAAIGLITDSTS